MLLDTITLADGTVSEMLSYQKRLLDDLNHRNPHVFMPPYRRSGTSILLANYILTHLVSDMVDEAKFNRVLIVSDGVDRAKFTKQQIIDLACNINFLTLKQNIIPTLYERICPESIRNNNFMYAAYSLVFFNGIRKDNMGMVEIAMRYVSRVNPNVKCIVELYS